jgi:4-hydroxy-tetrahydrodipicolinate reductase
MNIAILGYGKMGKVIEGIAVERGHNIVLKVDADTKNYSLDNIDVAIDFSVPSAAVQNISNCLNAHIPVVSGTTGWLDHYNDMVNLCKEQNGSFLYASNFSVGVNIFFEINKKLSELMGMQQSYSVAMEEIHHTQKLDAPSGTAISLANDIIKNTSYTDWNLENPSESEFQIVAKRIPDVPGTHEVTYNSEVDSISIKHTAHSRQGFALGAVIAAEWLNDKKGVFSMKDVLNIG